MICIGFGVSSKKLRRSTPTFQEVAVDAAYTSCCRQRRGAEVQEPDGDAVSARDG